MDEETRRVIAHSTKGGREFPQALSDVFGRVPSATTISLALCRMGTHFPAHESQEVQLLQVAIEHETNPERNKVFLVQMSDLQQTHPSGWGCFDAHATAMELYRLYVNERGVA